MDEEWLSEVIILHERVAAVDGRSVGPPRGGPNERAGDGPSFAKGKHRIAEEVLVAVAEGEPSLVANEHVLCELEGVEVFRLVDEKLASFHLPFVAALHADNLPNRVVGDICVEGGGARRSAASPDWNRRVVSGRTFPVIGPEHSTGLFEAGGVEDGIGSLKGSARGVVAVKVKDFAEGRLDQRARFDVLSANIIQSEKKPKKGRSKGRRPTQFLTLDGSL